MFELFIDKLKKTAEIVLCLSETLEEKKGEVDRKGDRKKQMVREKERG